MSHVAVHIDPVTPENLRKFAAILTDMANKLEPDKASVMLAIRNDLAAGYSLRQCASRNGVGVGFVRGVKASCAGDVPARNALQGDGL